MDKAERKAAVDAYKERKVAAGHLSPIRCDAVRRHAGSRSEANALRLENRANRLWIIRARAIPARV